MTSCPHRLSLTQIVRGCRGVKDRLKRISGITIENVYFRVDSELIPVTIYK